MKGRKWSWIDKNNSLHCKFELLLKSPISENPISQKKKEPIISYEGP